MKNIKITVLTANIIAIVVLSAILIGSTFAWFTDSVSSSGNKIQAGTLKVDLEILEDDVWRSLKNENKPVFDYTNWEPGYTDVKIFKVVNEGSLALKWKAKIVANGTLSALADVIDVYVCPSDTPIGYPTDRNLDGYTYAGTVADFVAGIETTVADTLLAGGEEYLGIALKMRSDAGNEFQGMDLLGSFDIVLVATQLSSEGDGFGDDYDSEATLDFVTVANAEQFRIALANKEKNIVFIDDIVIDATYAINYNLNINGQGHALYRENMTTFNNRNAAEPYNGTVFEVNNGATLNLIDIVVDGGANWTGEEDNILKRGTVNSGITAGGSLVVASGAGTKVVLGEGAVIQNNAGVIAVSITNATLDIDGGEIINNHADGGAIWGAGTINLYSGKINHNSSPSISGAVRMTSNNKFSMYGGEVSYNKATTLGGAIYTYTNTTLILAGGEMKGNYSTLGGAIYMPVKGHIYIEGDFRMVGNIANDAGGIRFYQTSTFVMTGGYIADNISINSPSWNGFYCWGVSPSITGGEIVDAVTIQSGTPTIGADVSFGALYLSNVTTCNLAEGFDNIRFKIDASSSFTEFKFVPAAGYTYIEGDEDKLVCVNEGYETYYDVDEGVFRIRQLQQ